ncbi:MAG: hypothetical protein JNM81_01735, partial [Rhodospirillaceae bacterium]|nr:hypothetical protein [Rhodospirillaceae bacterium]
MIHKLRLQKILMMAMALSLSGFYAISANSRTLDVNNPDDALIIARKMTCGSVTDGKVHFGTWWGRAYGRVPWEKDRHL